MAVRDSVGEVIVEALGHIDGGGHDGNFGASFNLLCLTHSEYKGARNKNVFNIEHSKRSACGSNSASVAACLHRRVSQIDTVNFDP